MVNSRDKGARGELEARDAVRRHWGAPDCIRSAQSAGSFTADLLHALPGVHAEVKRRVGIAAARFMDQAEEDRGPDEVPVVVMREDRGEWLVMLRLQDTTGFCRRWLAVHGAPGAHVKVLEHGREVRYERLL